MSEESRRNWEDFVNPEVMRKKLISASLFIAAYQVLEDSIVGRIKDFFVVGYKDGQPTISPEYQKEVLSKNRSPVYASLAWLREMGALDEADIKLFEGVKSHRNFLAHELSAIISDHRGTDILSYFPTMATLLRKIEVWWIVNVDIPTNPDFDGKEIDEAGIVPGPIMTLQLMLEVALGEAEQAWSYFNEFKKRGAKP